MKHKAINPDHYRDCTIEPIEVIEDWQLNYYLGNAVKYISRAGKKDDAYDDVLKGANYLFRAATGRWLPNDLLEDDDE